MRPPDLIKRCGCPERIWAKCPHGWHVFKMVHGTRRRIALDRQFGHTDIRSVAEAVAARDALLTTWRKDGIAPASQGRRGEAAGPVTLAELAARYQRAKAEDPERSPGYHGNLRACLALITAPPLGTLPVAAVTDDVLEARLFALAREGYAVSYRNKVLQTVRQLGRWAARKGYGVTPWLDPETSDVTRKKEARRDRRLRESVGRDGASEEDALLSAASLFLQSLVIAGVDTAARIGELLALQWSDVSFTRNHVTIRDQKNPDKPPRTIPLTARLAAVLQFRQIGPDDRAHDGSASVFGNEVGEPIRSILTAWETLVLKAHGFPVERHATTHGLSAASRQAYRQIDLKFHDLRHEAISRWAEAGVAANVLLEWTGHTNLETLSIYLNKARQTVAAAAMQEAERQNAASPWASLPGRPAPRGGEAPTQ